MIVVVNEINEDDPNNQFIVDLTKLPAERFAFLEAVLDAIESPISHGKVKLDDSFSYGEWCEDAIVDPPCHIDATVQLWTTDE